MQHTEKSAFTSADVYARIDLHLHLDGSLSPKTVRKLAGMQGIPIPEKESELLSLLKVDASCRDLNEYLAKFDFPLSLLQTEEAIYEAVFSLAETLSDQGLFYAEIRFAPQLHVKKGLSQKEVIEAAICGLHKSAFHAGLILCTMRGEDNAKANLETVHLAKEYLGKGVCAMDIAGAEALFPTGNFEHLFKEANAADIPFTIHAGEAVGPESVYKALAFGAKRIGHGVRSMEDARLVEKLAKEKIPLELCPTSNLNTNIFDTLADYPIRAFLQAGVPVTVNTDNMTVSDVTLKTEFQRLTDTFSLSHEELYTLMQNAADAAFAPPDVKEWLYASIKNIGGCK